MEKRVLLAVILSFLVLTAYRAFLPAPPPKQAATAGAGTSSATASASTSPAPAPSGTGAASPSTEPAPAPIADATVADSSEREIVVTTNLVKAVFSNRGGVLKHWTLLHYADHQGKPADLIPAGLPVTMPRPFSLRLEDPQRNAVVNTVLYRTESNDVVDARRQRVTLAFDYSDQSGFSVRKTFVIDPHSYVITFTAQLLDGGKAINPVMQWGPGLGDTTHVAGQNRSFGTYLQFSQGIVYADGKVDRLATAAVLQQPTWQGNFPFAGIDDHYFLASLVRPGVARITFQPVTAPMPGQPTLQREMMAFEALLAKPPTDLRVFFGPKDFDVLRSIDADLVRTIYYGIFAFLAVPLLHALKWINAYVGNYGWSIIILTFLINVLMFPLKHRSVVSMRKMQALQPQVKAIQDRYAKMKVTDPARQKMNQEMMQLYKEKGVNPASGCVPMLLTMPILFAFYAMLSVSIEIRGQAFGLWIHDLSQHDPYYITPVLMGLSMMWQQKLTPIADPQQAKIMMITPVMFLFFFLWAPSGLVIYWLVSNLLGIAQQYGTNRIIGTPVVKQVRPPAERRLKQAGSGRTEGAKQ
jgi:YidC/Oxa1 family membrane protein insertase